MAPSNDPIRILIAKTGLDGHDRGPKLVAHGLRTLGMEVIYLGLLQTVEGIVRAARDEDVDVVGLSCHCGDHIDATRELRHALDDAELDDVCLVVGGVFPVHDVAAVKAAGAELVFRVGEDMALRAGRIAEMVRERRVRAS